jgi:nucleoside-diphosphate-sugar epimerase
MNKIIVIGGSGFIGTNLCRRLLRLGYNFLILDIRDSEEFPDKFIFCDIRSIDSLKKNIPPNSFVINLAAEHRDNVSPIALYDQVNIDGARNLCEAANYLGLSKIVFTSSVAVYGFSDNKISENSLIRPFGHYGRTKFEAEKIYRSWQLEKKNLRSIIIVRPTVVFGENNRGNVFNLFKQIFSGNFLMIGDGKNKKSLAYVDNIADFLIYSLHFKAGIHLYNYIDKPDLTVNELISLVYKTLGRQSRIKFRIPYPLALFFGFLCDLFSKLTKKKFLISSLRIRKFCANSMYETSVNKTGFVSKVPLNKALERTLKYEFLSKKKSKKLFFSE